MNKFIQKILPLAVSQAKKSKMLHKHGAVLFKNKTLLGAGFNQHVTIPDARRRFSIHSEKDALTGLRQDQIHGASMLAIRINNAGNIVSGAPCKGCSKLMKRKGISKCYWFDENNNLVCTRF